jgi:DNA-directed RNA polymerase specialized sigma24 family protein
MKRFIELVASRPFRADGLGGPWEYLRVTAWRVFLEHEKDPARADRRGQHDADLDKVEHELRETGESAWALPPDPPAPGESVPESHVSELALAATRALSEKDQDLLRHRAEGVPYEEIGAVLGLSPKYARKRHCEVLKRLENSIRSLVLGYDPGTRSILLRRLGLNDGNGPAA